MEAPTHGPLHCTILLIVQIRCQVVSFLEIDNIFKIHRNASSTQVN